MKTTGTTAANCSGVTVTAITTSNSHCWIAKSACDLASTSAKIRKAGSCYKEGSNYFKYTLSGSTLTAAK